jgi:DNA-binding NarL/FixJ family response regulator
MTKKTVAMIRVVIADDHTIFRQGLRQLLGSAEGIVIVGEATDGHEALELVLETKPDAAILDISMPGLGGLGVAEEVLKRGLPTRVVFLTVHNNPVVANRALKAGVSGYVLKDNAFEDLLYALHTVISGGTFISPSLAGQVGLGQDEVLSGRERDILQLIASGHTNRQMAQKLFLSVKTIETHRANIMKKLHLHTTADLTRYAMDRGWS